MTIKDARSHRRRSALTDFITAARAYIRRIAGLGDGAELDVRELHALLGDLQAGAARLRRRAGRNEAVRPTGAAIEKLSYEELRARLRHLPIDSYSVVFDALDPDAAAMQHLVVDDLADIYSDLVDGFEKLRTDGTAAAIATWRSLYYFHWGRHAVHAQTALW